MAAVPKATGLSRDRVTSLCGLVRQPDSSPNSLHNETGKFVGRTEKINLQAGNVLRLYPCLASRQNMRQNGNRFFPSAISLLSSRICNWSAGMFLISIKTSIRLSILLQTKTLIYTPLVDQRRREIVHDYTGWSGSSWCTSTSIKIDEPTTLVLGFHLSEEPEPRFQDRGAIRRSFNPFLRDGSKYASD